MFRGYFSTLTSRVLPWREWARWPRTGFMSDLGLDTPLGEKDLSQNGPMTFTAPAQQNICIYSSFRAWGVFLEVISNTSREQKYPEYFFSTGSFSHQVFGFVPATYLPPTRYASNHINSLSIFLEQSCLSEWYLSKMTKTKLIDF